MIWKSIKIGIQRLLAFKAYAIINISGLALAIFVCLATLIYVQHHASFEKYINNGENSYRLISRIDDGTYYANTFACFEDVIHLCPEIKSHTLCFANQRIDEVVIDSTIIRVKGAIFADASFIDYFSVKIIEGEKASINQPNTMMLTPAMSGKLFPGKNAIGQTVQIKSNTGDQDSLVSYSVSGIIEPLPGTSHIEYEFLLSKNGHFEAMAKRLKSQKVFGGLLYVKIYPSSNTGVLEKKLTDLIVPELNSAFGPPLDAFDHKLQPVYDIHFTPGLIGETGTTIRRSTHTILILTGILILALAIMNFVIMYIARASFHQKATLIVRSYGGTKIHLLIQTILEVLISVVISFLIAFTILYLIQFYVPSLFNVDWDIKAEASTLWIMSLSLFMVVVTAISLLSSPDLLKQGSILKQTTRERKIKAAIVLVIFQFTLVIGLLGFTLMMNIQMKFIQNRELGYTSENVMLIQVPQSNAKVHVLKEELALLPGVISSGTVQHCPGYHFQDMNFSINGNPFPFKFGFIDQEALQTLGIQPLYYFTDEKEKATNGWLINETFYTNLRSRFSEEEIAASDFPDEESQTDDPTRQKFIIQGVLQDFHYASLHSEIENFAFFITDPETRNNRFVLVHFDTDKNEEVFQAINKKITEIYPGFAVNYSFLDEQLKSHYASEETILKLINVISILAILVACFGLIGLSIFITEKRTREIGIRKVNGASEVGIIRILCIDFLKWVSIAFIIATPVAYYATGRWLENFAYRTSLSIWIFILAGVIALLIAMITVSWQTFLAARKNPVETLRYQ